MADVKSTSKVLRFLNRASESDLYEMFNKIGSHLTKDEVKLLTFLTGSALEDSLKYKINSGQDLFIALAKSGSCDESNFATIMHLLKCIRRYDLLNMIHLRNKRKVSVDPVEEYLLNISKIPQSQQQILECSQNGKSLRTSGKEKTSLDSRPSTSTNDRLYFPGGPPDAEPTNKRLRRSPRHVKPTSAEDSSTDSIADSPSGLRKKYTCDVRLRVRAEYCNYETALHGTVSSNKPDPLERQLECFSQASAILRSRDLGYIVCDIKFSEITYLDAFWRDYLNGSLLEALKGVFITDTLKQAVGNEAIKLLVNVDEEDYEKGRCILLKNLKQIP